MRTLGLIALLVLTAALLKTGLGVLALFTIAWAFHLLTGGRLGYDPADSIQAAIFALIVQGLVIMGIIWVWETVNAWFS